MAVKAGGIGVDNQSVLASHAESLQGIEHIFGLVMLGREGAEMYGYILKLAQKPTRLERRPGP